MAIEIEAVELKTNERGQQTNSDTKNSDEKRFQDDLKRLES